jgi:hypothetical protein
LSDNEKDYVLVAFRVPKKILPSFDALCPREGRAAKLRDMVEKEVEATTGEETASANYEKLKSEADDCRREMDRLKKAMGPKFFAVEAFATSFAALTPENYTEILRELWKYEITPEEGFSRNNLEDYIEYVEQLQKNDGFISSINAYRRATLGEDTEANKAKPKGEGKGKPKKRYIDPKDLCCCGIYETWEEHNARCYALQSSHKPQSS